MAGSGPHSGCCPMPPAAWRGRYLLHRALGSPVGRLCGAALPWSPQDRPPPSTLGALAWVWPPQVLPARARLTAVALQVTSWGLRPETGMEVTG